MSKKKYSCENHCPKCNSTNLNDWFELFSPKMPKNRKIIKKSCQKCGTKFQENFYMLYENTEISDSGINYSNLEK